MRGFPSTNGLMVLVGALLAGVTVPSAFAQCGVEHPKSAKGLQSSLVQAYWGCSPILSSCCGLANTATEGGIPACEPPETFAELGGSQSGSWQWGPNGQGRVAIAASKNKVQPNPADSADLAIRLKLTDVRTLDGLPAENQGTLAFVLRATLRDRVGGPMTIVDFPLGVPAPAANGRVIVKTTLNTLLQGNPVLSSFPGCTSLEVESIRVIDPNGSMFASPGIFLPDL